MRDHRDRPRGSLALVLLLIAGVACAAGALCLRPAPAAAADSFSVQKVEAKVSLADLERAAAKVRREMKALDAKLRATQRSYRGTRAQLEALGAQLTQTRLRLQRAQSQLDTQRGIVADHMASMYKMGDTTMLDVLVGSSSISDFQNGVSFFDRIMEQERDAERDLATMTASVAGLTDDLESRRAQTIELQSQIDDQRAQIDQAIAQRQALLDDLVTRIRKILASQVPASLASAPNGGYTPLTWSHALLSALGMPQTSENVAAIVAWELAEGGHWHNSAYYNPLNTTQPMPGATSMNSVGVKAYRSWAQGLEATVKTLHNGYYGGILAALRKGDDAMAVSQAVAASPWGTPGFAGLL